MFKLYTDGSCKGNGKEHTHGGWAFLLLDSDENIIKQYGEGEKNTTNNRMELLAMVNGIKEIISFIEKNNISFFNCDVYTDSAYIANCYKQKWYINWTKNGWKNSKKEQVKNKDLWEELIAFFDDSRFNFYKVKGHSGEKFNEIVDNLAQLKAQEVLNNG